jgi:hypothetical protein
MSIDGDKYRYLLRPVERPNGKAEVLMYTERGVEGVVPSPGYVRGGRVDLLGAVEVDWSEAHMHLLFNFVGWNRRNVSVARPQGGMMWLTVVQEGAS